MLLYLYQYDKCLFLRFMNGAGLGVVLATVSVYIVEIATTDMRGFLGCFVQGCTPPYCHHGMSL